MKMLLTSAGIKNPSIHNALLELLGKPISESSALLIPTAGYAYGLEGAYKFVIGTSSCPMAELGWKSLATLELSALSEVNIENWSEKVINSDVLLVNGGDACFLAYWMKKSGFVDLIPQLEKTLYVGFSGGSMVMSPRIGREFAAWRPERNDDTTLGLVNFSIFPHLDNPACPENTMPAALNWVKEIQNPGYAIDDETAIQVVDGEIKVISEGQWHLLQP